MMKFETPLYCKSFILIGAGDGHNPLAGRLG
jgi:hypothetical protein